MSLKVNRAHTAVSIRKMIIQKYINGAAISEIANTEDLKIKTIKQYIDR